MGIIILINKRIFENNSSSIYSKNYLERFNSQNK